MGKSTMGRLSALRWPAKRYVDVGTIREILRPEHPELRLSTYGVWRLAGNEPTPGNLTCGFERYVEVLWPTVLRFLKWTAAEGNNLVMDGAMLSPRVVSQVAMEGLRMHPRMLCVTDPDEHLARMKGSMRTGSPQEARLVSSFPLVRHLQEYLAEECRELGIPIIENSDLEGTLAEILGSLPEGSREH